MIALRRRRTHIESGKTEGPLQRPVTNGLGKRIPNRPTIGGLRNLMKRLPRLNTPECQPVPGRGLRLGGRRSGVQAGLEMLLECFEESVNAFDVVSVAALQLDHSCVGEVQRK